MADSIIRCSEHLKNFTLIDNTCLKTPTLSMQAMGLFAYLMTLPSDWIVYKSELVNHFSNGRDAVYKAFNELIDNGFITFDENKNEKGQFKSYTYYIHEQPVAESERSIRREFERNKTRHNSEDVSATKTCESENGKPEPEKPYTENPSLLSTNKLSTDNLNSNSHCGSTASAKEKQKKSDISFKNEDYSKVSDIYFENCQSLFNKGILRNGSPVLPKYWKKTVKSAFSFYGVDNVIKAVKESINHTWLIYDGKYNFNFIFGPNELPMLINGTYSNHRQYQKVPQAFNQPQHVDLSDRIDISYLVNRS